MAIRVTLKLWNRHRPETYVVTESDDHKCEEDFLWYVQELHNSGLAVQIVSLVHVD